MCADQLAQAWLAWPPIYQQPSPSERPHGSRDRAVCHYRPQVGLATLGPMQAQRLIHSTRNQRASGDIRLSRDPIRTILLATDLSSASAPAEELAFELATRLDGRLLLVSVIDPRGLSLPGGRRQRMDQAREARQAAAQGIVDRGHRLGVSIRTLIWEGDPGEAIIEAASAESVDLIVVGSHQRRGVDRLVMGSVSERVVRTSPVPVVVARRPPG